MNGEEYVAMHIRAMREEAKHPPSRKGEKRPVRVEGQTRHLARGQIEYTLRLTCPRGLDYLYHRLNMDMVNVDDFEAACDHFGLRGVLEPLTPGQVIDEMRERKTRGARPSTGMLQSFMDEIMPREEADARIAIFERRMTAARARKPVAPAPAQVA